MTFTLDEAGINSNKRPFTKSPKTSLRGAFDVSDTEHGTMMIGSPLSISGPHSKFIGTPYVRAPNEGPNLWKLPFASRFKSRAASKASHETGKLPSLGEVGA